MLMLYSVYFILEAEFQDKLFHSSVYFDNYLNCSKII